MNPTTLFADAAAAKSKSLTKALAPRLLKVETIGDQGIVEVAFAQLEVVDHDGDYTLPGAFPVGKKLKVCQWGHAHYQRVVGAGEILGESKMGDGSLWAVARLTYFLNTPDGRAEFDTVKALQDAGVGCEWSYGYDVLDAEFMQAEGRRVQALKKLDPYEISPVLRGAGIGTHTLAVKSKDDAEGTCSECGQALPTKAAAGTDDAKDDDAIDTCKDCGKGADECECEDDAKASADAKGRAEGLALQWLATKARRLTASID